VRIATVVCALCWMSGPSWAQEIARVPLSEVMPKATAMAPVADGLVLISTKERGYMCLVTVTGSYADGLLKNDLRGTNAPKGTCVDVATFGTHADE